MYGRQLACQPFLPACLFVCIWLLHCLLWPPTSLLAFPFCLLVALLICLLAGSFLPAGKMAVDSAEKMRATANDIQRECVTKTLRSAVRTVCRRQVLACLLACLLPV